jgi:hypothetical protein
VQAQAPLRAALGLAWARAWVLVALLRVQLVALLLVQLAALLRVQLAALLRVQLAALLLTALLRVVQLLPPLSPPSC